jgi:hypothetical protein
MNVVLSPNIRLDSHSRFVSPLLQALLHVSPRRDLP